VTAISAEGGKEAARAMNEVPRPMREFVLLGSRPGVIKMLGYFSPNDLKSGRLSRTAAVANMPMAAMVTATPIP